ncbi:VanZ family protein [Maribacter sp. M208]|uniref:VanZ family protein n=1 Tax=Maribacter huludaoensis TaxID=3030010 RepID=UPI0023EC7EA4|nr:VanZ family protein [Maribacter huludaoensis]MDF4221291.1 VanZ family protein [Maribacter huludaoensis]
MFVTFFSLFSFSGIGASSFNIPHMDKIVHFTFYSVMVVLGYLAIPKSKEQLVGRAKLLWYIVLFAIVYGIIIEVLQHVATSDRHGDPLDALANSTGALVGLLVVRFLFFRVPSLK